MNLSDLFNEKNTRITIENINNILLTNLEINEQQLNIFQQAFVHKSYCKSTYNEDNLKNINENINNEAENFIPLFEESNERLEFLGDHIYNCIVVAFIYNKFPNMNEGNLNIYKQELVNGTTLSKIAKIIGLDKYIILPTHIEKQDTRTAKNMLENTFEAFIGALYANFGFNECEIFIIKLMNNNIDWDKLNKKIINGSVNHKHELQMHYQKNKLKIPNYIVTNREGPPNNCVFYVSVSDQFGNVLGDGNGQSIKQAQQNAAENAMKKIKKLTVTI